MGRIRLVVGLHQGGCYDRHSCFSPFGAETYRTYLRAVQTGAGDTAPAAGSDGC